VFGIEVEHSLKKKSVSKEVGIGDENFLDPSEMNYVEKYMCGNGEKT